MRLTHIHTSGHAFVRTLKKVVKVLKPKTIIPIHTLYPNLYETLFPNVRLVSDGEEIRI